MTYRILTLTLSLSAILVATRLTRTVAGISKLTLAANGPDSDKTATASQSQLSAGSVAYKDGDQEMEGYLAYDPSRQGKRPGVLIVHEWWGLNDYPKHRARQLAELGYVAFAADIYGKGMVATNQEAAGKLAGQFRADRDLMRRRVGAALAVLKANPRVDPNRIAAIGYCFGGTCVLELARDGAALEDSVHSRGDAENAEKKDMAKRAHLLRASA